MQSAYPYNAGVVRRCFRSRKSFLCIGKTASLHIRKTVLLISHRLANVVDSDCIYMMKDGKICEQGKHKELLALDGTYGKLYKGQMELENYSNPRRGNSEVMGADRKEKQFFTKESKDKN